MPRSPLSMAEELLWWDDLSPFFNPIGDVVEAADPGQLDAP